MALGKEGRRAMGEKGRQHVNENYNFNDFEEKWVNLMLKIHEKCGSWEERKGYNTIKFKEVA